MKVRAISGAAITYPVHIPLPVSQSRLVVLHMIVDQVIESAAELERLANHLGDIGAVLIEADWPHAYQVNRYVRGFDDAGADAIEVLSTFDRWPTWMWGNQEIAQLVEWLRHRNDRQPFDDKVGFYGLDVYSLWESMRAVLDYLKRVDGATAAAARKAFECFEPYQEDVQDYARATI